VYQSTGGSPVVFAFNTIYAGIIQNGTLITPEPAKFTWDEDREVWVNRDIDVEIEWIGHVMGVIAYLSSPHIEEVEEWIRANCP